MLSYIALGIVFILMLSVAMICIKFSREDKEEIDKLMNKISSN